MVTGLLWGQSHKRSRGSTVEAKGGVILRDVWETADESLMTLFGRDQSS